ncbi:hypothetical protein [Hymenobacter cavernae]|uniref:Uncharacterized protein n=1 Tax=Hymenobacter cavernae TaxID=2044852 RepID=A0ABQ1TRG0_9BACT|nr:hypothetical protein [Hymenobacter cavernae]GGF00312.1 hypothetical protein GCM10011383_08990 [Hymenobacter cavernae]
MAIPAHLQLYDPLEGMRLGPQYCFLCGAPTEPPIDSVPVFAYWLMDRYDLADRQIQLLDQSIVTYRDLRIPCCQHCRTHHVEPLEAQAQQTAELGLDGWRALSAKTLFLWLGKMFYGVFITELLTELNPLVKPRYPLAENAQMFRRFHAFFQTFQALRVPIEFEDFTPASLYILEVDPREDTISFEYDDDLTTMVFSIKLGNTVLMACFADNGIVKDAMRRVVADTARPLHPIQIAEFKARVYYGAYLFNVVPDYYARPLKPGDDHLVYDTLIDDITSSVFNPWENSAYGQSLQEMWKRWDISYKAIMQNPAQPLSFLYDDLGQPRIMDAYVAS